MKKKIMVIIAVLGIFLATCIAIIKYKTNASVAIIGGADGPTSIFLAGTLGDGFLITATLLGLILLTVGSVLFMKIRRK